jgi:23S rRNA (adenine2030-N6)-methyltransferase
MNYRHAYHAGNFADVHKHIALVAVLLHLRKKEKPFAVIDTHAGAGLYDLASTEALKTAEAAEGIGNLRSYAARTQALQRYLEIANAFGPERYPGSPLITAKLLRPQDRLIAIEKHPEELEALRESLGSFQNALAAPGNGYKRLGSLLPPPERRGLVLIDPPYEAPEEMEHVAHTFARAYRRFSMGIFLLWYPLKVSARLAALAGEIRSAGPVRLLSLRIDVGSGVGKSPDGLSAAGLLVVNPPYGFDTEMEAAGTEILPQLCLGSGAQASVEWLSARH